MQVQIEDNFDEILEVLSKGQIEVLGQITNSSNVTVYTELIYLDKKINAVYKPERGERPLHDFPSGLYKREQAAYDLSEQLGWDLVPPTVVRDGPLGIGSIQFFIDANFEEHYFTILEDSKHQLTLKKICAFDYLMNNTDRKSSHCLLSNTNKIWAIDHGLCFHEQYKLRTVIWDFTGQELPVEILDDLQLIIDSGLTNNLKELLTNIEIDALYSRCKAMLKSRVFPIDETDGRRIPWPRI